MTLPLLSVVYVNFRTPELVIRSVRSVLQHGLCDPGNVVIVDNMSGDNSAELIIEALPDCRLIRATDNKGYGAGLNLAVQATDSEFILCLNPDTYFEDDNLRSVIKLMQDDKKVGLVGLDLFYPDGSRQYSARRDYTYLDVLLRRMPIGKFRIFSKLVNRHLMKDSWANGAFDADWVIGTGFVVRSDAYTEVGGMDTDYFLYMEDVDLCMRLRKAAWRVVAMPNARLIHDHQRASATSILSPASKMHLRSLRTFIRKHGMSLWPS